jgi:hypothetical protein
LLSRRHDDGQLAIVARRWGVYEFRQTAQVFRHEMQDTSAKLLLLPQVRRLVAAFP